MASRTAVHVCLVYYFLHLLKNMASCKLSHVGWVGAWSTRGGQKVLSLDILDQNYCYCL